MNCLGYLTRTVDGLGSGIKKCKEIQRVVLKQIMYRGSKVCCVCQKMPENPTYCMHTHSHPPVLPAHQRLLTDTGKEMHFKRLLLMKGNVMNRNEFTFSLLLSRGV